MSALSEAAANLASRITNYGSTINTEEAIKTSVVLPFLQALGYDVFNPSEIVPEFTADTIGKKGEKVDYAILRDGEVAVLIECKSLNTDLGEKHLAQLYRYFTVTNARFAMLTNGRHYQFYSDLTEPHRLDRRPFFIFDLLDHNESSLEELAKFGKSAFDVENILAQAERLKFVAAIKPILIELMAEPSDDFVKLIASQVYDGRLNSAVKDTVSIATKAAFREIMRDRVRARLNSALEEEPEPQDNTIVPTAVDEIETTEVEIEGFLMVKSMLRGTVDSGRVVMRDAKSYCAVLLDNNNRKPLARLHFNRSQKYFGIFDGDVEDKIAISGLDELFDFKDRLITTAQKYEKA
ncbi:MAG: type I restriction enzyme HsdR N-terminal domain-containing protein [Alphaproteobacteria bacterium]|nr:type I restriction enzyme HsdR N-terminal domain-containing protein [Alphaproteobacteria bacterium]